MRWMDHGWMAGGMWLFWLLVLLVIVGLVVWIVRQAGGSRSAAGTTSSTSGASTGAGTAPGTPGATKDSAEELLRERYARGEVDQEEFEERLRALRRS